ncbi:hypothetical protein N7539_004689 [Penicillium diatomitis]|uniref:Fe2OG dioxygenase domain-containing protein n=1 Tax=Penicillium diatomitis TaxID=2819901 RepID=A0A9W9X5X6_9EURO|nr:uncharacterized protein N7539_004689 [Penicillium diatomitis]KAJ5484701.1 hypothetical protein N7539_004689 [Penicillium diatomitis]
MDLLDTLDLSHFHSRNELQRAEFCRKLLHSFQQKGFVKLIQHGLSAETAPPLIEWDTEQNQALFALSQEKKAGFAHPPRPNPHRGYSHVGQENISGVTGFECGEESGQRVVDLKESLDHSAPENKTYPNIWPDERDLPGFQDALALALGLDEHFFDSLNDDRASELRLLHYLEVPKAQIGQCDQIRIAEHTDFGSLTLLMQDGSNGLEVQDPATGSFFSVQCTFPTLILNVGDSMMRWMNKRIHSACHRVPITAERMSPETDSVPARHCIAYFGKPNPGASLKPLDTLVSEEYPAVLDDMKAHDYDQSTLRRIYAAA